ncbi:ABC transporter substrate-binding protein [Streptomyces bungoensis]|uniref:ABC transporter substrate-binding protein n=1 Tax=Streptomyces bungoensis TaxID=285568 RepID=A0A124I1B8_9ACTN|nr:substrate-binding domain-containing protein [Streptomyces bungoensis]KUN77041.1 ABC transporter substrate-binding protein [Streptomyces bungoensis]
MKALARQAVLVVAAVSTTVAVVACGTDARRSVDGPRAPRIGVLLPDAVTARWETRDRPLLENRIRELCGTCRIEHANARNDVALQQEQMDSLITKGVDAILLVAVDAKSLGPSVRKAHQAGIPVIAYDRLADGPISGYVSFDGEEVGREQGRALLTAMGDRAHDGRIVMMNGDLSDPNAVAFKRGALSVLRGRVRIARSYDTEQWSPEAANKNMSAAISALGADAIDGVYAANDGLAGASISALKANKVRPLPPVTGQDAELAAVRRIVAGDQYMTVYKPFGPEAAAGGALAVAAVRGDSIARAATDTVRTSDGRTVPAVMLTPVPVTVSGIKDTLVKRGAYTVRQICTPQLRAACRRAGLT